MTRGTLPGSVLGEAGASAMARADLFGPLIDSTERQVATLLEALHALRREQRNYRVGGLGERRAAARVERVLVDLGSCDWHLLADRRWPGTRSANLDLLLVGPPGVLLLDAKSWAEPRIEGGSLWRGQDNADDALAKARDAADAVAGVLADVGLAPAAVRPLIVLMGRKTPAVDLGGVTVVGELALQRALVRLGPRLDARQVEALVAALDERCPPAATATPGVRLRRPVTTPATAPASPQESAVQTEADALLAVEDIWTAALEAAMREPIEAWMTWLHPTQAQLVTRHYSGPARVRGAAGTGKTVVALHRARHLARPPGARVLVTSYVRTLPAVHRSLFGRLAPDLAGRVEFRGLHSWAARLLRSRGRSVTVAPRGGRTVFDAAWSEVGAPGPLGGLALPPDYWWEEVENVIKGRALGNLGEYLALDRVGRRTPLRQEQRTAVWGLYESYRQRLHDADSADYADLLALALDEVRAEPVSPAYTAVVVDEVQDLSCVGLRLLHALVGDASDGLLLVGDGQQAIYPGGFTLTEAGVSVTGRATILDRNYRNAAEILRAALELVAGDEYDDLDAVTAPGQRPVETSRTGGLVKHVRADDAHSEQVALLAALTWAARHAGVRTGDMAVLLPDNFQASRWARTLDRNGVPAQLLTDYDGTTNDAVKVGTYQRAKGLEFACVFLPDHDRAVPPRGPDESEDMHRERSELQRRQVFVAMTRARDRLWLGTHA